MRLLFVASVPMEFRAMLPFTHGRPRTVASLEWAYSGTLGSYEVLFAAHGAGWKRASAAVDAAYSTFGPDAVISTGFCGALDPRLRIGDVVVGTAVASPVRSFRAQALRAGATHGTGVVSSIDHVARTVAEKRALRASGGSVVEMEAAGVAARAEALRLPFYCVRAVTDTASEDMANDFNAALRADGHFDTMLIFRHALSHPVARIPELLRLRRNCERAARTLGEFFADCQL
jgi:nucleoside phosphorylase